MGGVNQRSRLFDGGERSTQGFEDEVAEGGMRLPRPKFAERDDRFVAAFCQREGPDPSLVPDDCPE